MHKAMIVPTYQSKWTCWDIYSHGKVIVYLVNHFKHLDECLYGVQICNPKSVIFSDPARRQNLFFSRWSVHLIIRASHLNYGDESVWFIGTILQADSPSDAYIRKVLQGNKVENSLYKMKLFPKSAC